LYQVPSLSVLRPLPVGLLGRTTTSMERMRSVFLLCSSCRACRDAQLNSSEPQNNILRGSDFLTAVLYAARHNRGLAGVRESARVRPKRSILAEMKVKGV